MDLIGNGSHAQYAAYNQYAINKTIGRIIMGKALLIIVAATMLAGGSILYKGTAQTEQESTERISQYASNLVAREIAYTGMGDAVLSIEADLRSTGTYTGPSNWTHSYQGGHYAITISVGTDSLTISATGTQENSQYVILREYAVSSGTGGGPPFMAASITSEGNIIFQNDITLRSGVPGENANIHANDNIKVEGGTAYIEGFGYRVGNTDITNGQSETDVFQPVSNPGSLPVTQAVAEISIPSFSASSLASGRATDTHYGNLSLSGLVTLGTEQNPRIWYIDGNLKTTGDILFDGYGVFLVTGNVDVFHNISMANPSVESTVGMYVDDNIRLNNGHLVLAGQLFAKGNIYLEDQTTFTGTLTTLDNYQSSGRVLINYKPASSALTNPFWPGTSTGNSSGTLTLLSTREWAVEASS